MFKMQSQFKLFVALFAIIMLSCKQKNNSTKIEVEGEVKNIEAMMAQFPGMFAHDSIKMVLFEVPFGGESQL
ncbi:MAG: hypothetical protein J7497_08930, partial [Chitinophagaceae bacterium]|nr:hypothetical protein [Chitinophagaceae bacterium]